VGLTKLLLVRHGETVWNVEGRLQGQLDIELNEAGRRQAADTAAALRSLYAADAIDAIVSSDLSRARQTADAIAVAFPGARRYQDAGLREVNCGSLQGRINSGPDADEGVRKVAAEVNRAWLNGDLHREFPEGESCASIMFRGIRALRSAAKEGSTVIVVAHGGLIRWSLTAIALFGGGELATVSSTPQAMAQECVQSVLRAPIRNCCCSTLFYDPGRGLLSTGPLFESLLGDESARDDTG